jgi:uncharacterized membrane protein YbhN (UPF0104 family)
VLHRGITLLPVGGAIALLVVSYGVIRGELDQQGWSAIWESFTAIPLGVILLAIAFVIMNYGVMTGYDTLALRYIKSALPYRKTAFASTISYSISNTIGATFLSGSALRYRFYKQWGFTTQQIAQIIAFCNLSFWLGMLTMGGLLLLTRPSDLSSVLPLPAMSLKSCGVVSLSLVATYLVISSIMQRSLKIGIVSIPRLSLPIAITQIGLTFLDWAIAATTIYILLRPSSIGDLPYVIGVYVVAQWAGVLSSVPGGIGVFETVMVVLLAPVASTVELLGALVAFRILHHIVPLVIGLLTLMGYEVRLLVNKNSHR